MLRILPTLDSEAMAAARQRELAISGEDAARIARETVEAVRSGRYTAPDGHEIDWKDDVAHAVRSKASVPPGGTLPRATRPHLDETRVSVSNQTTLAALRELREQGRHAIALNFANGVEPGGGFLLGARAQEEALCRASALHATLLGDAMYAAHRKLPPGESSAWCIVSHDVPVFRADDGTTLERPWLGSFITCAAPYEPSVGPVRSALLLADRIYRVLEIAAAYDYDSLVLGAWGCGAFGNNPTTTARDFRTALESDLGRAFGDVVFAIADWSPERRFLGPFRDVFAS